MDREGSAARDVVTEELISGGDIEPHIGSSGVISIEEAQIVDREVMRLSRKLRRPVTRDDLLQAATPATSPLHGLFEWNDKKAAHEYRLIQAGVILRAVVAIFGSERDPQVTRAIVNVTTEDGRGYVPLDTALATPSLVEQMCGRALLELESHRLRVERFVKLANDHELLGIFEAIRKLNEQRNVNKKGKS